jgi:predicted kinase
LTVIDATNVTRGDRAALLRLARRAGRKVVAFVFELPLEVCLERNRLRQRVVVEGAVADQWRQRPQPPAILLEEGFEEVHVIGADLNPAAVRVARAGRIS